jgi:hypothetical protein
MLQPASALARRVHPQFQKYSASRQLWQSSYGRLGPAGRALLRATGVLQQRTVEESGVDVLQAPDTHLSLSSYSFANVRDRGAGTRANFR